MNEREENTKELKHIWIIKNVKQKVLVKEHLMRQKKFQLGQISNISSFFILNQLCLGLVTILLSHQVDSGES